MRLPTAACSPPPTARCTVTRFDPTKKRIAATWKADPAPFTSGDVRVTVSGAASG
jgi:hypothetical protein